MAAKHRKRSRQVKKIAAVATATATVSALTVGAAPAPQRAQAVSQEAIDLAAAIQLLPDSDGVPDLTGGLGSTINNAGQAIGDQLIRAVVNGINLAALAQAAGIDPQSLLTGLLADIPANLLPGILASLSLDIPILGPVLEGLDLEILTGLLDFLGLDEVTDATLTGLLGLIGWNLADPLNLAGLAVPGLNVITTGPTFATLKMLGLDLGWLPALPNSVANEINNTGYLEVGAAGVLEIVRDKLAGISGGILGPVLGGLLGGVLEGLGLNTVGQLLSLVDDLLDAADPITGALPDLVHVRITPTVGVGLGAFAAAMAYDQVIADLKNQPGGLAYNGTNPLLGSLTLLPMVLVNNPGRPDGGAFARFGPLAALFGIDTVNPRTELTGNGGLLGDAVDPLGLHIGGANVLPILIDATYEYQAMSDFAAWPNPFTLANNLASALMPTYMLRGLTLEGLDEQLLDGIDDAVDLSLLTGDPLALNLYLTLQSKTLPLVEPLFLAADFLNLVGLSPLAQIPLRLANALMPALRILTDVGYSNVVQNADGTYTRDFTNADAETPFMSFANIDYGRVLGDAFGAFVGGVQKEFFSGNPTASGPNVLKNLLDALLSGDLLGGTASTGAPALPDATPPANGSGNPLGDLLGGLLGGLGGLFGGLGNSIAPPSILASDAANIPDTNAAFSRISIPAGAEDEIVSETADSTQNQDADGQDGKGKAAEGEDADKAPTPPAEEQPAEEQAADEQPADETVPAAEEPAEDETPGKHAKPQTEDEPEEAPAPEAKTPKHAKPDVEAKPTRNVVRDIANAFSPKDKPGPAVKSKSDNDGKGATEAVAATETGTAADSSSSSEGGASDAA